MTNNTTTCPRCESENVDEQVTTDIPNDDWYEFGCNDCLYVWGDTVEAPEQTNDGEEEMIELPQAPEDMDLKDLRAALYE